MLDISPIKEQLDSIIKSGFNVKIDEINEKIYIAKQTERYYTNWLKEYKVQETTK